ncbi:MAG TPA: 4a-hydroxytetrahydrobiopterin dehydratase [Terriglobales bacterium]|nr:4a-hydroxytetrahydrobiopterin dehydratase [Terriglobales bacterium]
MATPLAQRHSAAVPAGTPPLRPEEMARLQSEVPGWTVRHGHELHRSFQFPDFVHALAFVNRIGEVAEQEQHHPDIGLGWGRVDVTTYTHSVDGLSENDFILAARVDALAR